jgi:hypothetical protein
MIKRRQFVVGRGLRLLLATVLIIIDKFLAKSLSGRRRYRAQDRRISTSAETGL